MLYGSIGPVHSAPDELPYKDIDMWEIGAILRAMNEQDARVSRLVGEAIPRIAAVVDAMVDAIGRGGRIHYFGAGTSGRLAVLDASECPPTFGVSPGVVQGHMAGGLEAFTTPIEGLEDDVDRGASDARQANVCGRDVVVGVTASGNTPYVVGAVREAGRLGARTVALVCAHGGVLERISRHVIVVDVGDEVVAGSTRLKAGTAQKMVLNMLTTATFSKLGHVYDGLMVAVRPDNAKLVKRAVGVIQRITGAGEATSLTMLQTCGMDVRVAIVALALHLGPDEAQARMTRAAGNLRLALAPSPAR